MEINKFKILIHGGAGTISGPPSGREPYVQVLKRIIANSYSFAKGDNRTAIDIVEYAITQLEDEPLFNAGCGAVLNRKGEHELEASIMDGSTLKCGAVSLLKQIKNPISAARLVMDKSEHIYIAGESAENFARQHGLQTVPNSFFTTDHRLQQLQVSKQAEKIVLDTEERIGTVGCVCMFNGFVAAGTSTGGMTNKMEGRIGDSPLIGAGTYANNLTCAVSATGKGEEFIRHVAAYDVAVRMDLCKMDVLSAVQATLCHRLPPDSGGFIAVDREGNSAMEFNTKGMYRASVDSLGIAQVGVWLELEAFTME
mmetsp:Transcript_27116/g.37376  ORF Transcript_27116/g.37376 Transcript_27116/m.37376 type:complete len:311 (+) Transcript_27116:17-949(+)